jgi:hypothetical protein
MGRLYRSLTDSSGPPKIAERALRRPTVSVKSISRMHISGVTWWR